MNTLGIAYAQIPAGDRAENLRRAAECFEAALRVLTEEAVPHFHAGLSHNLARARRELEELAEGPR